MKNTYNNLKEYFISLLFSLFLFFWPINVGIYQFRHFILLLIFFLVFDLNREIFKKYLFYFFLTLIILIHSVISMNDLNSNFAYKVLSLTVLFNLFIIFDYFKKFFFNNLDKIFLLYLIIFFCFLIYFSTSYDNYLFQLSNKCVGCFSKLKVFYRENSHFGLLAPTIIYYLLYISKINKFFKFSFLIIFVSICILNLSITFVAGIILMLFFVIIFKVQSVLSFKFLLASSLILITIMANKNLNKEKIFDFFAENNKINFRTNVSTEVYEVSLFIAKKTILENPLGYGFNNYKKAHYEYINQYDAHNNVTKQLNKEDGSITFSKIVTEFGIFSIIIFYFIFSFAFNGNVDKKTKVLLLLPLITQLFIRGVGYFNGGFILFLFFIIFMSLEKKIKKKFYR